MRIYISGKITGLPHKIAAKKFKEAENKLLAESHSPINPMHISNYDLNYGQYMQIDKILISYCDAIYMIKSWQQSPGARCELEYAIALNLKVLYEEEAND